MPVLSKTTRILDRAHVSDDAVTWSAHDPDTGRTCIVTLERAAYDDLGRPDQLTVTIEPGDQLNP